MILITGPGRSGTTVLALLYRELGFDPGGVWRDDTRSGLEDPEIVALNEAIIDAVGLTPMGAPGGIRKRIRRAGKALIPSSYQSRLRSRLRALPWMESAQPGLLDWPRLEAATSRFGSRLTAMGASHAVAKDPRFLWTLPVWAASGVALEHVAIAFRNLDASVTSRGQIDSLRFRTEGAARNSIVYGFGLALWTLEERGIPHSIVHFPAFLEAPTELYRALRFPEPVSEQAFAEALARVRRPELIHHSA